MATAIAEESSSSSSRYAYHVFLSFRGKDTRKKFTDHLYKALLRAGVHTFIHDDEIQIGESIQLQIKKAIQESEASIIVFSRDYASSTWCLDEVAMIMERRRIAGHIVLPVFYGVDPSQVSQQTGSYREAFAEHEKCYKEEMDRVNGWRAALREVAELELEGKVLGNRYESQFILNIVKEIGSKLNRTVLYTAPYLVDIDSRIADINLWPQDRSDDVSIATIYGTGGIGKTTIAKIVYNLNFDKFEGSSFLANIRETSEQANGLVRLQRQLLSDLLKEKANKIYNVDEGILKIKNAICCRKVLLVLDDVDELYQLNAIIGMQQWFCPGSKILITTRHKHLLRADQMSKMFEVEELDKRKSLKLFSWHAFKQEHPIEGYVVISRSVVHHCGGLPLALQVLGSSLFGKSLDVWESALLKLKAIPFNKIQQALRISYDSIEDDHDKNIFLDIACFFTGVDKDYVVSILNGCGLHPLVGIDNLVDRFLITLNEDNKLVMHRLIRDMGREVIRQESPEFPAKRSRLCKNKDAFIVLSKKAGTESIRGLQFDLPMFVKEKHARTFSSLNDAKQDPINNSMLPRQENCSKRRRLGLSSWQPANSIPANLFPTLDEVKLKTKAFTKMKRLELLRLNYIRLRGSYKDFPEELVWLCWRGFPLKSIPKNFLLEKLVVLEMRNSNLINIWKGRKVLVKLKILDLSHSHSLIRTPNFTGLPFLERLKLKDCINLVKVDESIGKLHALISLNLKDCKKLKKLPEELGSLESLKELILSGCSKLDQLSEQLGKSLALRVLYADGTSINQLQSTIEMRKFNLLSAKYWHSIFWSWVTPVKGQHSTSFSLATLPCSLVILNVAGCNLNVIPNDLHCLPSLEHFDLSGNPIDIIPESINKLTRLKNLMLNRCTRLQSLPELPRGLKDLRTHDCNSLERITNLPNLFTSLSVETYECDKLVEVQGLFKLEPIGNIYPEILNNLGLFDLELLGSIQLELGNVLSDTRRKIPLQVPSRFSYQNEGCSLSFELPQLEGHKICGLNLCIVYTIPNILDFGQSHYAKINNKTKGVKWTFSPTFYGIPEPNEDMLWLSHWKFGDQMEGGDHVNFYAAMSRGFQVKKCGVYLTYELQEYGSKSSNEDIVPGIPLQYQNLTDHSMSAYEMRASTYFLCNHWYLMHQDVAKSGWDGTYDYLFEEISEQELDEQHILEQELEASSFEEILSELELAEQLEACSLSSDSD